MNTTSRGTSCGREPAAHVLTELLGQLVARLHARTQHHEGLGHLTLEVVGHADDRGHRHGIVRAERSLDLAWTDAIAGGLDHVVLAGHEPEVAVFVLDTEVAGEEPVARCTSPSWPPGSSSTRGG